MTCPICSAASDAKFRPFCSKRCADLDLARWLGGRYAIPSDDPEDAQEAIEELEKALRSAPQKPH
ncbi:DNA gyrase inhibitor YacG [Aquicoccus sp. G2-2]|uniref:DNA gyrase inhibitor YacG n=1 Tax=Aquicoccus sp. G2-2 TaxID=3092120 RepID=UPI002AE01874|nr:DNA gyrase inhibitor YacG [Aquicoccus sp. G2-2]MEA1112334.1 DNA gyrase inhibitor YacG [Aquicoccus sp. G2-2]